MNRFIIKMPKVSDAAKKSAPGSLCNKINAPLIALLFLVLPIQVIAQDHSDILVFGDTLTSGQINKFGDYSVENALSRFAGVQMNREGKINIRGLGYTSYYVTMDGQRLANTGFGDRSFDLRSISADMTEELQLIKILSPDMDADAISGVINMSLRKDVIDGRFLEITAGGGLNPHYIDHTNAANRFLIKYAERFSEDFSISLNLNYQKETNAWDQLNFDYGQFDFGNGLVSVPEQVAPGFQTREISRLGANLVLNYQPSAQSNYYLQGMVNSSEAHRNAHQNNWLANNSWADPQTTGNQANLLYNYQLENRNIMQFNFLAGGENELDHINIQYELGWAQSNISKNRYRFPFELSRIEYVVDRSDAHRPQIQMMDEDYSMDDLNLQTINYVFDNHLDTRYSAKVDVEMPFSLGSFKLGTSALLSLKDALDRGAYSNYDYDYRGVLNLSGFERTDAETIDIFNGTYHLPWLIDAGDAVSFFEASIPNMRLDRGVFYRNSDIWNYQANENIYAGYGMATLHFGSLDLIGGLRMEYTSAEYTGRNVAFNRFDQYETATDISHENKYLHVLPNAQIFFAPMENSRLRLAYSRSLSRPDFNMLAPFELATPQDTSFFRGNPDLKPLISDNLDLILDQYYSSSGKISAGFFYKKLSNHFIYSTQQIEMVEGDNIHFDNFFNATASTINATENSFRNSEESASIYGIELSWQDQLTFLPGAFKHFGIFANYTWSQSDYDAGNGGNMALITQSPHIINAALNYDRNKFSAQLSYHWTAEISNRELDDIRITSLFAPNDLYRNYYQQGRQNLSATIRYDISDRFQIWADANNLISNDRLEYANDPDLYPLSIYHRQGFELMMGLKFTL